jgi:hypothetical protein
MVSLAPYLLEDDKAARCYRIWSEMILSTIPSSYSTSDVKT